MVRAIDHANRICNWQENLGRDELPPSWMWPYEDELRLWFEEVERKRTADSPGSSGDEEAPMMGNDLAASRRG